MPAKEKKKVFAFPVKYILTETGSSFFFMQKMRPSRIKMEDNTEEYGLTVESVTPSSLQRLLLLDYVSKIEYSGLNTGARRKDIIDITKLIIYSLFYRQFTTICFSRLVNSDPVKKWNRANPFMLFDEKTRFKGGYIQAFMQENAQALGEIRRELLTPLCQAILKDTDLLADEKNMRVLLCEKFLDLMNPVTWVMLYKFWGSRDMEVLLKELRNCVREYTEKAKIADYVALMLIEVASTIESMNIQREAAALYPGANAELVVMTDPALRNDIVEVLKKRNSLVTFLWRLGMGSQQGGGGRNRFQISIYDKEPNYKEIRGSVEASKAADITRKNFIDFYESLSKKGHDSELGMYYMSYVNEACERVGLRFEPIVNQVAGSNVSFTTFSFYM
jgi:hypothetical protein